MDRDYASAAWADNHAKLSDAIAHAFHKLAYAFRVLNAIEYDAPWRRVRR